MSAKKMTDAQAKKFVQGKLAEARKLLDEAGLVMDEHEFNVEFLGVHYMPRRKYDNEEAADGNDPYGVYLADHIYGDTTPAKYQKYYDDNFAGEWMPSSDFRGC